MNIIRKKKNLGAREINKESNFFLKKSNLKEKSDRMQLFCYFEVLFKIDFKSYTSAGHNISNTLNISGQIYLDLK